jgi:hypothetical protein
MKERSILIENFSSIGAAAAILSNQELNLSSFVYAVATIHKRLDVSNFAQPLPRNTAFIERQDLCPPECDSPIRLIPGGDQWRDSGEGLLAEGSSL